MAFTTIISAHRLHELIEAEAAVLALDCTFDLTAPGKGREIYTQGHLPGARYVHLDDDLSARPDGANGRHPLPDPETFAQYLRSQGLHRDQQVVAYDANGGHFCSPPVVDAALAGA